METIALHTRLKQGRIEEYEAVHAVIPPELDAALRRAGVKSWRIWRDGHDLFHCVEVQDCAAMAASLATEPADEIWQGRISLLLEARKGGIGSDAQSDNGMSQVWELPAQPPSQSAG
ncbi:L-rhamnose mutarotase [Arthrobacter sp. B2a2-09]|uniref:L-rhamnose mutarotase n=1 Tax=Arthrobacter sp. B2a2-09 TaxID=2952822 RepID=UPI0022CDB026|nr:L-rhamnose mutarotase [Arthrobacter sp. B2a2-09]MCZ9880961.1 L-rhamnose mutarotase [Arthrobacter sp. B2a2-09]